MNPSSEAPLEVIANNLALAAWQGLLPPSGPPSPDDLATANRVPLKTAEGALNRLRRLGLTTPHAPGGLSPGLTFAAAAAAFRGMQETLAARGVPPGECHRAQELLLGAARRATRNPPDGTTPPADTKFLAVAQTILDEHARLFPSQASPARRCKEPAEREP